MVKIELETLQLDCEVKARNLKTATESLLINPNSVWILKNYLSCLQEAETSVTNLVTFMEEPLSSSPVV